MRWIITKSALMEGWDCPFAYLLVMLDNTRAQRAITQLVGRVMRQPHARRTGRELLDQCYVYCWNTDVGVSGEPSQSGLEQEGLTGLGDEVLGRGAGTAVASSSRCSDASDFGVRTSFSRLVLHKDGDGWTELDYQRHILPDIDWAAVTAPDHQGAFPDPAKLQSAAVDVGDAPPIFHADQELHIDKTVSISWFARRLSGHRAQCVASRPHCPAVGRRAAKRR